jgi:hypothetical protein
MTNWTDNWQSTCRKFKTRCFNEREKFLAALNNSRFTQDKVFNDIISNSKKTQFGKGHALSSVNKIKDYCQRVPIRNYEQFTPWLDKEIQQKGGVLTGSPIARWLKTSGSTGNSKKIPYTEHWMANYRVPALGVLFANYIHYCPEMLAHSYATLDTQTIREPTTEFLNGIPYQGISNRNTLINKFDWQPPWYDAPWFTPDVPSNYDVRMYYRLRHFLGEDLRAIFSINPSTLIALKHHLIKNFPTLLKEISDGTICGKEIGDANPSLAKKLEKLHGHTDFTFKDVWPNLSLIACWTAAAATLYLPQLEKLFPDVKILPFMTCGTEGIATLPIDDHLTTGPLAITQGFYEFLPAHLDIEEVIKEGKPVETLLFNELKLGEEYHLIMSQANGICRLAVGDIYKVIDFCGDVPRIEFTRRQGTYYSFTGEKVTETQMLMAIESTYKKHQLDNNLFICSPVWGDLPYYKLLVEIKEELAQPQFKSIFASDVDNLLCQINGEYRSKRESNRLGAIQVQFTQIGAIDSYHERKKATTNATQFKYKPFQQNDTVFTEILSGIYV